ncbi:MAG TPA: ABC transporter ATP-binding protein [Gemmatimonadales bacterium]|nr:ABC transporter ATP-binding protein [Gemmatimonadales bacterium]
MSFLTVDGLRVRFSDTVTVGPVSLGIERGEILALLGPSGSGKTTLLRMLAGFETPDGGRVRVDGEDVTSMPPASRRFGMVFQHYALFPHLDVGENVAFGLAAAADRDAQVAEALGLVDLAGFERRKVQELSGGQQQRVALARALAPHPRVLLLDEPLSNLDPSLRERTRRELREVIGRVGITSVFVTHEQEEAFDLGDRVAVLNAGRLEQVGTPDAVYDTPASLFVATFVGRANVLKDGACRLFGAQAGETVVIRPEDFRIVPGPGVSGVVKERRFTGASAYLSVELEGGARVEVLTDPRAARVGDRVTLAAGRKTVFG